MGGWEHSLLTSVHIHTTHSPIRTCTIRCEAILKQDNSKLSANKHKIKFRMFRGSFEEINRSTDEKKIVKGEISTWKEGQSITITIIIYIFFILNHFMRL